MKARCVGGGTVVNFSKKSASEGCTGEKSRLEGVNLLVVVSSKCTPFRALTLCVLCVCCIV